MSDDGYASYDQIEVALNIAKRSQERTVQDALRKLYFAVRMMHGQEIEHGARVRERSRITIDTNDA